MAEFFATYGNLIISIPIGPLGSGIGGGTLAQRLVKH